MQVKVALVGQPRSGTSLLMRILVMGGVDCEYEENRPDDIMQKFGNIYGFFEIKQPTFTKCFKAWHHTTISKIPKDWKIIYIERDVKEMCESWKQVQIHKTPLLGIEKRILFTRGLIKDLLKEREVLELKYDEVQENPLVAINKIKEFLGEDFDVEQAIKAVDGELYIKRLK